ncbi:MAG: hypothetical protein KGZ25_15210, partial [Planctomycetes bacterium]|nr:hypothetical protein [Planctomycetota bacterium]
MKLAKHNAPFSLRWGNLVANSIEGLSADDPVQAWRSAGKKYMGRYRKKLALLQKWYPNPPYIVMLSNNEGKVPGKGKSSVKRYKAVFDGMREGAGRWGEKFLFIGYAWGGPANINVYKRNSTPLAWDGVSAREYAGRRFDDCSAVSIPVTSMNLRLKKKWYESQKERYFFEISTFWYNEKKIKPARYGSMATWAMWLSKPHCVRHFTGWGSKREGDWLYFSEVVEAVDQVHKNETLKTFWRHGEPVVNPHVEINIHVIDAPAGTGSHAQGNVKGFVSEQKLREFERLRHCFYHLSTNLDPEKPKPESNKWEDRTEFPKDAKFRVWAQAQVMGEKPKRRWLLFAYAPKGDERDVQITIPDCRTVTLDVPQEGVYAVVEEGRGIAGTIPTVNIH